MEIRLQKWCSQLGLASRREAEAMIMAGEIRVNGEKASLGQKIDPDKDRVEVKNKTLTHKAPPAKVYWLLNKPAGFLCSRKSEGDKETIYDLKALRKLTLRVNSIGRLDYMSEGLLLLSNDGELSHRLCHPSFKLARSYKVLINEPLSKEDLQKIRQGVELDDGMARCEIVPANQTNLGRSTGAFYFVTVLEGRNRLVRRIFESQGKRVLRLVRDGFGDIKLDMDLKPGEVRQLTPSEIKYLKYNTGLLVRRRTRPENAQSS